MNSQTVPAPGHVLQGRLVNLLAVHQCAADCALSWRAARGPVGVYPFAPAGPCLLLCFVPVPAEQSRELSDVGGDAPSFVAGER
jgi:hypothetical protein